MTTRMRTEQWFNREYQYLRKNESCRVYKDKTEEGYISNGLMYNLFFDKFGRYIGSMVSELNGTPIVNYEVRK